MTSAGYEFVKFEFPRQRQPTKKPAAATMSGGRGGSVQRSSWQSRRQVAARKRPSSPSCNTFPARARHSGVLPYPPLRIGQAAVTLGRVTRGPIG
jgi:hypothetical protein